MTSRNFELHIEELVLDGFDNVDGAHVRAAVEHELARLLTERGVPSSLSRVRHIANLEGGTFDVASDSGANAIGSQVAQALYRGFGQ